MSNNKQLKFETRAIHAGQEPDPQTGAVVTPIVHASTFVQHGIGEKREFVYARTANPTRLTLERCIADLEGARVAYAFPTGLAAASAILELLDSGAHVIAHDDLYGGLHRLLEDVRTRSAGLEVTFVDFSDADAVAQAVKSNTRMLWYETPSNPLLKVVDIAHIADIAKSCGALSVCDNTFSSPYLQQPLALGADIAVHSATKFLNGHSDLLAGAAAISTSAPEWVSERLPFLQNALGAVLSAPESSLLLRSIKTLPLRMQRHCENARAIAEHFHDNRERYRLEAVHYPGLPDHPGHEIAAKQMRDFGAIVTLHVEGGIERADRILRSCELFKFAVSLGGVESLIQHPASLTHAAVPKEKRDRVGVTDNLIRLSVGIEDAGDLIADLEHAFTRD